MRQRFGQGIGILALLAGAVILLRDLLEVHSLAYAVAGVGMLAFGAWRLQALARVRR